MDYVDFLKTKDYRIEAAGFDAGALNPLLYPFQADIVRWATKLGRAAIFADCGMGKSFMQLAWAREVTLHTGRPVLIVAPIAVGQQTIDEGKKLGIEVVRAQEPGSPAPIQITNYERLHKFLPVKGQYAGIVLDESSILKSLDGSTRTSLLKDWVTVPYRLACTATPAPNDVVELCNHAEFLGTMSVAEMKATFFVHDSDDLTWRLKGHASTEMWRWMARWARFVRRPSDLGYEDGGWQLPPLTIRDEVVATGLPAEALGGIAKRSAIRKQTLTARVQKAVEIIKSSSDQWLIWCGLNDEEDAIVEALGAECVQVSGQTKEDDRIEREADWRSGRVRCLATKPKVFGFGLNWQHCHRMLFLGLGDSYEQYYQAVRRCWRFGQQYPVEAVVVISDVEGAIAENVRRKEADAIATAESIVAAMRDEQTGKVRETREDIYKMQAAETDNWAMINGDSCEVIKGVADASVGFSVYSPPFASLYTYSSSRRDLGNSQSYEEFFNHYAFLLPELLRVTMPGRRTAVHCAQVSTTKATHGVIGWRDFRGDLIRAYVKAGWIYDGEICIDKNPQAQAIRTKSKQLMFVQKEKDSSWLRPAMADYILLFRHPGENTVPVKTDVSNEEWILFAHPIWYGIRESNVLKSYKAAREDEDEKHICPLQLETIERCIRLWSNPGEVVLSPFGGIGSEGYVARRFGRKYLGIELKESYWKQAVANLQQADAEGIQQPTVPVDLPVKKGPIHEESAEEAA
jgi:DNA modification methylase/superfamily II DNA or RNA helicase